MALLLGAAASTPTASVDVFTSGEGPYNTYRIPAIVSNPGGKLLCFVEGRKFSTADHGWNGACPLPPPPHPPRAPPHLSHPPHHRRGPQTSC